MYLELIKFNEQLEAKEKILVFGTGEFSNKVVNSLKELKINVQCFIDNDVTKWGTIRDGKKIKSPEVLKNEKSKSVFIIVASMYFSEISSQLNSYGFIEGTNFIDGNRFIEMAKELTFYKKYIEKNNEFFPFIKSDIQLNGVDLTLVTHFDDKVLGAMIRGEIDFCKHFLAELTLLQETIEPNNKVLDIGSNIGAVAIPLAKLEPTAIIYCFEPDPLNYMLLNLNIRLNDITNIVAFNYALGSERKYINFFKNPTNFGDHRSFIPTKSDIGEQTFIQSTSSVYQVNPREFFKELFKEDEIIFDLIKIDTQGADFAILQEIFPLIKSSSKVVIEYSPYHLHQYGTKRVDVNNVLGYFSNIERIDLNKHNYQLKKMTIAELDLYYTENNGEYKGYCDLILTH